MVSLKSLYSIRVSKNREQSLVLSRRLFETYNSIAKRVTGRELSGTNVDLGSGSGSFSVVCREFGINSYAFDYKDVDLEKDKIPLRITALISLQ